MNGVKDKQKSLFVFGKSVKVHVKVQDQVTPNIYCISDTNVICSTCKIKILYT